MCVLGHIDHWNLVQKGGERVVTHNRIIPFICHTI